MIDLNYYEKVILYNSFRNDEYFATILDHVDPVYFHNLYVGKMMNIIKEFYIENSTLPNPQEARSRLTSKDDIEAVKTLFKELKGFKNNFTPEQLIKDTETFIKQRALHQIISKATEEYSESKLFNEEETLAGIEAIQEITLIDNLGMDFMECETLNAFKEKLAEKDVYISTGYKDLDDSLGGGLHKEGRSLVTFGGETNVGKSIVLANLAANIMEQDYKVLILSFEMSEFRYAKRMASILTEIPSANMLERADDVVNNLTMFRRGHSEARLIIKEFPPKSQTAASCAGYIKKLARQRGFKPDAIILDYHTLLRPQKKSNNKHEDFQTITQEVRALTYTFECPAISVLQLNRGASGANNAPAMNTIAGSWDMLADIDTHVNIWQADGDREANVLRYATKKGRDGSKNDEKQWHIDYSTLKLRSLSKDDTLSKITDSNIQKALDDTTFDFDMLGS